VKKICILTATRAEYGLLKPIILALKNEELLNVAVVVTGMHLSPEFGLTYKEIERDGIEIDDKIPILLSADTPAAISKTMGLAMIGFGEYFERSKPDMLVVLGDRYETLAICCAAANVRIPIAHLYGGETTEGAVDEAYRHAITKMSYLHFTSTEEYRKRVIQLGESPERVYTVGAIGIENILSVPTMPLYELEENLSFELDVPYAVVTFHPVTIENCTATKQIGELLEAVSHFPNMKFIFTKANADADGRIINRKIDEFVNKHENIIAVDSLGTKKYLCAIKYSSVVIGNSSSGLVEVPSFGLPTVNIGDRQKGRMQSDSVINCLPECGEIIQSIKRSQTAEFKEKAMNTINPYGDGKTSDKIVSILKKYLSDQKIDLKKHFYNIDFEVEN